MGAASGWMAEAGTLLNRFPDANVSGTAYLSALAPVVQGEVLDASLGYSFSYQGARESRYVWATSGAPGLGKDELPGQYLPYYTPSQVQTHSAVGAITLRAGPAVTLHASGAYGIYATEQAPYFASSAAPGAASGELQGLFHTRSFHPWNVQGRAEVSVARGLALQLGAQHERTA